MLNGIFHINVESLPVAAHSFNEPLCVLIVDPSVLRCVEHLPLLRVSNVPCVGFVSPLVFYTIHVTLRVLIQIVCLSSIFIHR